MNYYEAREIMDLEDEGTGLWHFTKKNDGIVWPVGYCAKGCTGHPTPEEADAHFHEWALDHEIRYGKDPTTKKQCQVCGVWTIGWAEFNKLTIIHLCADHRNRETVADLTEPSSQIIASW